MLCVIFISLNVIFPPILCFSLKNIYTHSHSKTFNFFYLTHQEWPSFVIPSRKTVLVCPHCAKSQVETFGHLNLFLPRPQKWYCFCSLVCPQELVVTCFTITQVKPEHALIVHLQHLVKFSWHFMEILINLSVIIVVVSQSHAHLMLSVICSTSRGRYFMKSWESF